MLSEAVAMYRNCPLALVVRAPSAEKVARREADRTKTGYTGFSPVPSVEGSGVSRPRLVARSALDRDGACGDGSRVSMRSSSALGPEVAWGVAPIVAWGCNQVSSSKASPRGISQGW